MTAPAPVTVRIHVQDGKSDLTIARTDTRPLADVFDVVVEWVRAAAGIDGAPRRPDGAS